MLKEPNRVLPYWFPTTAVLVDDDAHFLANFSLGLDDQLAYRSFGSAKAALRYLDALEQAPSLYRRCCSVFQDGAGLSPSDQLLRFDVSLLAREINNPDRFSDVTVVLVDYDMPEMDGLAFCRRVANPHIKKVLFTGVADEKIAVAAFNEGLIDRFILKSEENVGAIINRTIRELQYESLLATSRTLADAVQAEMAVYLGDAMFRGYFNELCRREGLVEHYLTPEPRGFLCLTAEGLMRRLLVYTEADLQVQWEIATDQDCPAELAEILRERKAVPAFRSSDGFYRPECTDWQCCLHQPDLIYGQQLYYVALIPDIAATGQPAPEVPSYRSYLSVLDAEASQVG